TVVTGEELPRGLSPALALGKPRYPAFVLGGLGCARRLIHHRLIGRLEDVRLARIELALNAPDDPVAHVRAHLPLQRVDVDSRVTARFGIVLVSTPLMNRHARVRRAG